MKNRNAMKIAGISLTTVCTAWAGCAEDMAVPRFQAGDRFCVIGDSISHSGMYHSLIYLFYATRFPGQRFEIFNCGISGDSADGAVRRFDWDIAPNRPTLAAIMLGMNDIWRELYGVDQTGAKIEAKRQKVLDQYAANMTKLADRLKASNCQMIFITPSIYDQTGQMKTANLFGCNDALGRCAQILMAMAPKYAATVVDFHGPMTALNMREQQHDPAFTLVGADRVHPGELGHYLMAYLFLKAQQVSPWVAKMVMDAKAGKVVEALNCKISNATADPQGGVAFTALEGALPFPISPGAAGIRQLVPFEKELNQEVIGVINLAEGNYEIVIDDVSVAVASAADLAQGVNLAANPQTPMYKQALKIQKLEAARKAITADDLRVFAMWRQWVGGRVKNPDDFEAMKTEVLKNREQNKDSYIQSVADIYITRKPQEAQLKVEVEQIVADIWKSNQPKPHKFIIRKAVAKQ